MTDLSLWQRARRKAADKIKIGLAPFALERGALSVTFDDFPRSAWETGGEILAKFGVLGTYYVSGGLADRLYRDIPHFTAGDLEAIAAAGHEIGCHTFDHISTLKAGSYAVAKSISSNQDYVAGVLPALAMRTFAYPFGDVSIGAKLHLRRRFGASRGVRPGFNGRQLELTNLRSFPLEHRQKERYSFTELIKKAAEAKLWMIVFTHDVSRNPSPYGCTPGDLELLIGKAFDRGLEIAPVAEILTRGLRSRRMLA